MKTRKEIEEKFNLVLRPTVRDSRDLNQTVIIELLLDIRELLQEANKDK